MKKMMRCLTLMVTLSCLFGLRAETVSNYLEKFDNMSVGKGLEFAPPSWGRIADSYIDDELEKYAVEYTNPSGGKEGSFLKVGGQQQLVYDDWEMDYVPYTLNDYLITPAVGGEISFYLKKTGSLYSQPNVKIYLCTKNGKEFKLGALKKQITYTEISDTWKQFVLPGIPVGTYLAFRLDDVGIDEFAAETAEAGRNISMGFTSVKMVSSASPVTSADNKFEVTVDATVKNIGEVDLTPGMKNYSLSLVREEDGKIIDLLTVPVEQTIKIGQTGEPVRLSVKLDAGTETQNLKYSVRENLTQNVQFAASIISKPYRPEMMLCDNRKDTELDAGLVIDYGFLKDQTVTKTFRIMNNGFAPLNITSLTLPEGYTTTLTTPVVVEPKGQVSLPITLGVEKSGTFKGNLVLKGDGVATLEYSLFGVVLAENDWFENFEKNAFPQNMVVRDNWVITNYPDLFVTETNNYWAQNNNSSEPTMLMTPKLNVKAGESFSLKASKRSSNTKLNIYYSADRVDWKLAKEVNISDFSSEKLNSASDAYKFTLINVDNIPEGEWYIGIEGGYVRVDDLYGFTLVPVEHDFFFNFLRIPSVGMVNNVFNAAAGITNLAGDENADSYSVKLYVNGEAVAESECPKFGVSQEKAFNASFTPHETGEFEAYFEITAGNTVFRSAKQQVLIKNEIQENSVVVGKSDANSTNVPLSTFYKGSASQTIYTADRLGLEPGTKITKISYSGYCTSDDELIPDIAIYMENTKDAKTDVKAARNVKNMTAVYKGKYSFLKGGSKDKPIVMLSQSFEEPFVYTGDNLRIALEATATTYKFVNFMVETNNDGCAIYRADDHNLSGASWKALSTMPVITIYTEKEAPVLSGKVYTEAYGPLPNVKVKLISDNVWYSGTTNEQGQYSISVVQSDRDYQAVIDEIPNYEPYTYGELINMSAGSQLVDFCVSPLSGVEKVESDGLAVYGGKGCIVVKAAAATTVNVYNIAGRLVRSLNVEEGTTAVRGLMAGFYIVNDTKVVVR